LVPVWQAVRSTGGGAGATNVGKSDTLGDKEEDGDPGAAPDVVGAA
jgi:hypothetical protein